MSTSSAGAEAIPFIKVWGVVPAAILFTLIYAKLSNVLSRENLFYVTIIPFLVFFGLFVTVIYPNLSSLQPNAFADSLKASLPTGAGGFVESIRNWPFGLFYILAELWGSVVLSLLFWAFANDTTKVSEANGFTHFSVLGLT